MSIQWIPVYGTLATGTNYFGIGGSATANRNGTEVQEQAPVAAAGSFVQMLIRLTAAPGAGASYRIQVSKNGVASTVLDVTISGTATSGTATGVVAFSLGDLITLKTISSGSPGTPDMDIWLAWQPTTTDEFIYFGGGAVNLITSAPQYMASLFGLNGQSIGSSESERFRNVLPFAGTLKRFYVSMETAPGGGNSWDLILTQNGSEIAATALNISGTNKVGNVTALSTAFASGDYTAFKVKADNGATNTRAMNCGICIVPTSSGLFAVGGANNGASIATTTETYGLVGMNTQNDIQWGGTESAVQRAAPAAMELSAMFVRVTTAPGSGKSYTYAPRKGGADTGLTVAITNASTTASTTGASDTLVAGDLIDIRETPAGTPAAATDQNWAIALRDTTGEVLTWVTFGNITREHDVSKFAPTVTHYFEGVLATSGGTGRMRLFNVTDGAPVAGSEVTTTSASPARVRTASFTLSGTKTYRVEQGYATGNTTYAYTGDLIVDVSADGGGGGGGGAFAGPWFGGWL